MTFKKYIRKRQTDITHFRVGNLEVYIKEPLPEHINAKKVIKYIVELLPTHLLAGVDIIYIGQFDKFLGRKINASYNSGAIYITNEQDNFKDMVDDIIHEVAHSVEEVYVEIVYADQKIKDEFRQKREKLFFILKDEGYDVELEDFLKHEYSPIFDNFLLGEVGYPILSMLASNLFISPYAITSLKEYFAVGFEAYFFQKEVKKISEISPNLFEKIQILEYNIE